ncbi:MAG TPA: hypothetical protein VLR94_03435 [Acidobacteriota bacterium]|nr:hypothetical protein [Acidobacteriota bacterium]
MKRLLALLLFTGLATAPAFGDSVTFLGGYVLPRGDSDVYKQNEKETTFRVSDLNGFGGTIRYDKFIGEFINISGGVSFFDSHTHVQDVEFVQDHGQPILRDIFLEIVPLEASLHVLPAGRNTVIIPYLGGGFGLYYWQYEEHGDFVIDRLSNNPQVITGRAYSDGWDPGYHIEGGVHVPVGRSVAVVGEAKYWHAHGKLDVRGFDPSFQPLDLSGMMYSGGVSVWF